MIQWIYLEDEAQLNEIRQQSFSRPQLIFKHSTRCGISAMVKSRLESSETPAGIDFYVLNLIAYRPISNKVTEEYQVPHQSPQVLLIREGKCVYDESHSGIEMAEIAKIVSR